MRINQFIAQATGMSRRAADKAIEDGKVLVNQEPAQTGQQIDSVNDTISLDRTVLGLPESPQTILLHKPVGYVCSRDGQGSKTIYDLLPPELHQLKPVGRLDKDSSGLLLLTNDGKLAHELTHPSFQKKKIYEIELDKPLAPEDKSRIEEGVPIDNYMSSLRLTASENSKPKTVWIASMSMGRNRQIRRTFEALGYKVTKLHRTQFGPYELGGTESGTFQTITA